MGAALVRWVRGIRGVIWAGVCLLVGGFIWDLFFAGLPYQDPTPQMQANWKMHKSIAEGIMPAGALLIGAAIGAAAFRSIKRRLRPGNAKG